MTTPRHINSFEVLKADKRTKAGGFWTTVKNPVEWKKFKKAGKTLRIVYKSGKTYIMKVTCAEERTRLNALPTK
jgi:hypothetical protein